MTDPVGKMTEAQKACLQLVAVNNGRVHTEDKSLNKFIFDCGDYERDTLNQCFSAGLLRQVYDTSYDAGYIEILPAGRRALAQEKRS